VIILSAVNFHSSSMCLLKKQKVTVSNGFIMSSGEMEGEKIILFLQ